MTIKRNNHCADRCPICGANIKRGECLISTPPVGVKQHRCDPAKLKAIDAALNTERDSTRRRTIHDRLGDGFDMLGDG